MSRDCDYTNVTLTTSYVTQIFHYGQPSSLIGRRTSKGMTFKFPIGTLFQKASLKAVNI